jgi:hypothetical protein
MNAALAMIEAAAPRDEIEGALAVQMARTLSLARLRRPPEDKADLHRGPFLAARSPNITSRSRALPLLPQNPTYRCVAPLGGQSVGLQRNLARRPGTAIVLQPRCEPINPGLIRTLRPI